MRRLFCAMLNSRLAKSGTNSTSTVIHFFFLRCTIVCAIALQLKTFSCVDKFVLLLKTFSRGVNFAVPSRFVKFVKIKPPRK